MVVEVVVSTGVSFLKSVNYLRYFIYLLYFDNTIKDFSTTLIANSIFLKIQSVYFKFV